VGILQWASYRAVKSCKVRKLLEALAQRSSTDRASARGWQPCKEDGPFSDWLLDKQTAVGSYSLDSVLQITSGDVRCRMPAREEAHQIARPPVNGNVSKLDGPGAMVLSARDTHLNHDAYCLSPGRPNHKPVSFRVSAGRCATGAECLPSGRSQDLPSWPLQHSPLTSSRVPGSIPPKVGTYLDTVNRLNTSSRISTSS
jgi:hypothetical protein